MRIAEVGLGKSRAITGPETGEGRFYDKMDEVEWF